MSYPVKTKEEVHNMIDSVDPASLKVAWAVLEEILHIIIECYATVTSGKVTLDVAINSIIKNAENKFMLEGDLTKAQLMALGNAYYGADQNGVRGYRSFPAYDVWLLLSKFTSTPADSTTIATTSDLSFQVKAGLPMRWQVSGVKFHGIVESVTPSSIKIYGESLNGTIEALWLGTPANVAFFTIDLADKTLNATSTNALSSESTNGNYLPFYSKLPTFKIMKMEAQFSNKGTGANPRINMRVSSQTVNVFASDLEITDSNLKSIKTPILNANVVNVDEELALRATVAGTAAKKGFVTLIVVLI
jgi:hypothetical protein